VGSHIVVASSATRRKGWDTRFSPRRSKLVLGIGVRVPTPQQQSAQYRGRPESVKARRLSIR